MGQTIQKLWENYKRSSIHIMGITEGEEKREKKTEEILDNIEEFSKINHRL